MNFEFENLKKEIRNLSSKNENVEKNLLILLSKEMASYMTSDSGVTISTSNVGGTTQGTYSSTTQGTSTNPNTSAKNDASQGQKQISPKDVHLKKPDFLQFIELLSDLLTNENQLKRANGIFLLIHCLLFVLDDENNPTNTSLVYNEINVKSIINHLDMDMDNNTICIHDQMNNNTTHNDTHNQMNREILNHQSITVLFDFMLSRLDDHASVDDLLTGFVALLDKNLLSKSDQLQIVPKIIKEINVQNYPQNSRYNIFKIFALVLKNNLAEIKVAPLDYITAFIHSMDGEKDPRNLLLLFQIALSIIQNLNITEICQDLFEVVYCYFPITFRPQQNDIYQITANDLKTALRNVVSSTSLFATFAIPVLMEKVSSSSPSAKIDAFETISSCLPIYTAHHFIPHLTELWKVIKAEIASNPETELELACLKCLRDIAKALSHAIVISSDPKTPLSKFLHAIITECIGYFKGTEAEYIKPCGKIIASLASSSLIAANTIGEKVFYGLIK